MPTQGTPQHLPPGGSSAKGVSPRSTVSGGGRSPSPLRLPGGMTVSSQNWLSVKNPDMMSVPERVGLHNQAIIATSIDELKQAFTHFASARLSGKQLLSMHPG